MSPKGDTFHVSNEKLFLHRSEGKLSYYTQAQGQIPNREHKAQGEDIVTFSVCKSTNKVN